MKIILFLLISVLSASAQLVTSTNNIPSFSSAAQSAASGVYAPLASPAFTGVVSMPKFTGTGSTPTIATGAGAGTGSPTASITGKDMGGYVTIVTGTSLTPAASATVVTITFNAADSGPPNCIILTPANAAAAALSASGNVYIPQSGITGSAFTITAGTTPLLGATTYAYYYHTIW